MNRPSGLFRTTSCRECVCLHGVSAMINLQDDDPARTGLACSSGEQSFVPALTKAGTV